MRLTNLAIDQIAPSVSMISLHGEHDLSNAPDLSESIAEAQEKGAAIVFDLSAATFVDSSILGVLVNAQRTARAKGLGLALYMGEDPAEAVSRILGITGLEQEMQVWTDREAAVAAVQEGRS